MKYLPELDKLGYRYYFQYTLTGYPPAIEPKSLPFDRAIKVFKKLSIAVGKEKVIWRYDPILFSNITDYNWHIRQIKKIGCQLKGYARQLVISFVDSKKNATFGKNKKINATLKLHPDVFSVKVYERLAESIGREMRKNDLPVFTCSEKINLTSYGINFGKCIDGKIIAAILNRKRVLNQKDPAQRKDCGCIAARDIGANNTCVLGCKYCYATNNPELAKNNFKKHDKNCSWLTKKKGKEAKV